tara:strand:- start:52 stop:2361 length:2310 start_codon:yes stop_codon:yes gene_type:complete
MKTSNYKLDPWKIIEQGWDPHKILGSESIFSIGNGSMGQRANFEEDFSGKTLQGSYIAGIYYPDKTKVGWWKNGYPEYFAKVINAPNWIGISIKINDSPLDLYKVEKIERFERILDMKKGLYQRLISFKMKNDLRIEINSKRFLSMRRESIGAISYSLKCNRDIKIDISPFIDFDVSNNDSNWDEKFWDIIERTNTRKKSLIKCSVKKTGFNVITYMKANLYDDKIKLENPFKTKSTSKKIALESKYSLKKGRTLKVEKFGGYVTSKCNKWEKIESETNKILKLLENNSFESLFQEHENEWARIWEQSDIEISGDNKSQQAIRFNIFHLNQTYKGDNPNLNFGPKGFTGEKYGGSTYWDTEAYCIPFCLGTKPPEVTVNLLDYRHRHLDKAIENAKKLGFKNGAALFPMVTMNGEECHNEWEITFEEIHRNNAIAYAIFNYSRYTGDYQFLSEKGIEILIGICRFWAQRVSYSYKKKKYVILGVTGPNEYENNVNNNWYTNYSTKWCFEFTIDSIITIKKNHIKLFDKFSKKLDFKENEMDYWLEVSKNIYLNENKEYNVFVQQDGFFDKELNEVDKIDYSERPLNQNWSWDRILRSPYIKQADVLQGIYFFEDEFNIESIKSNYEFYQKFTVHESSLSPCIHSILASKLGKTKSAYDLFKRGSRLDLDDYNSEVNEGLHITSMAGSWLSIVEGFAGMRVKKNSLHFTPRLPENWEELIFKIHFRKNIFKITVKKNLFHCSSSLNHGLYIHVNNKKLKFDNNGKACISI